MTHNVYQNTLAIAKARNYSYALFILIADGTKDVIETIVKFLNCLGKYHSMCQAQKSHIQYNGQRALQCFVFPSSNFLLQAAQQPMYIELWNFS